MAGSGPGSDRGGAHGRFGARGASLAAIIALLVAIALPLVALPAVRCAAFGSGCPSPPGPPPRPGPSRTPVPLTPVEAATRGRYVALGDSYSSGEGSYGGAADLAVANRCHRTSQAYFHVVAKAFKFARGSALWACSGATTRAVLTGRSGEPPQVDRVDADTSLVTITIGGNDAGFSRVLATCMTKVPFGGGCREQAPEVAARLAALRVSLAGVLDTIADRAPSARVIVLGYPRLFSEVAGQGFDNLSVDDQRWLNSEARELGRVMRETVQEADRKIVDQRGRGSVEFVDAYSGFAGHEVGRADPYVNGLNLNLMEMRAERLSFHPTAAGYRRLADLVVHQITAGPGRRLNQYR
jgi:lysophospholipase L1-like esterase